MSAQPLRIDSDLTFSVTGPDGPVTGTVTAAGHDIEVRTDDLSGLFTAVGRRPGRSAVAGAVDLLCEADLSVSVVGPHGRVLSAGVGPSSTLGRMLTGSSHIRSGRPAAVIRLGWDVLSPIQRVAVTASAVGVVIAAARR